MCGRYTLAVTRDDLAERFDATVPESFEPRYNCAPGQELPVVANDSPDAVSTMEWGLVPAWADERSDGGFVNARGETVREKRSFREPFERRRCLVPADGFYEWTDEDGRSRPYRVAFEDDRVFSLAGVWERWRPPDRQSGLAEFDGGDAAADRDATLETFAVLTTEPNDVVAALHDRMPVILPREAESTWLGDDPDAAADLLAPAPADELRADPVSTGVNSPANDYPGLLSGTDA